MGKDITFNEKPYHRVRIRNLLDESDDMKWKVLEYHNQDFVLKSIVNGTPFTVEGHKIFLEKLPELNRKQYVVYYDENAVGKVGLTPTEYGWKKFGCHLFHESDLGKGYGFLMMASFFLYGFRYMDINKLETTVLDRNIKSTRCLQCLGAKIYKKENDLLYLSCTKEDYEGNHNVYSKVLEEKFG